MRDTLTTTELRTGISLALVYVFRMLGLFMVIPVIAVVAQDFPDYSPLLVGIAIGGYGLTQAILQIPFGLLSDRWGRKPVIFLGLGFFAVGSLIAGLADSMLMVTLGRVLQGAGAIAGAVMALAADATRESQRAKVMAIIGVSIGFSFYLALFLGPIVASKFGLQGIFLFTTVFALCCFPLVQFGVGKVDTKSGHSEQLPQLTLLPGLFKHHFLWRLNVIVLVIHLLITTFFIQIPLLLVDLGEPLDTHYQVYLIVLILSVFGLLILLRLSDKLSLSNLFNLAVLFMAIGFVIMTQAPSYFYVILCGIAFFTGFNFLEAKMPALVSSIAPAGQKGSAMGIYASFQFFGAFLGGSLSGVFATFERAEYSIYLSLILLFFISMLGRGLSQAEQVKRFSLSLNSYGFNDAQIEEFIALLIEEEGVRDLQYDADHTIIYIKSDAKAFSFQQAQARLTQYAKQSSETKIRN